MRAGFFHPLSHATDMPFPSESPPAPSADELKRLREKARFIRLETIRLIEIAKVGHYSSVFSAAELFASLYYDVMDIRANEPRWPDRDRFLMGKGHAAVGLFPILAEYGYIDRATLDGYTRLGNPLGDHPDMRKVPGIDFSSGSIGHALSAGAGLERGVASWQSGMVELLEHVGFPAKELHGLVGQAQAQRELLDRAHDAGARVDRPPGRAVSAATHHVAKLPPPLQPRGSPAGGARVVFGGRSAGRTVHVAFLHA